MAIHIRTHGIRRLLSALDITEGSVAGANVWRRRLAGGFATRAEKSRRR